jgi:hypothetical protein
LDASQPASEQIESIDMALESYQSTCEQGHYP